MKWTRRGIREMFFYFCMAVFALAATVSGLRALYAWLVSDL